MAEKRKAGNPHPVTGKEKREGLLWPWWWTWPSKSGTKGCRIEMVRRIGDKKPAKNGKGEWHPFLQIVFSPKDEWTKVSAWWIRCVGKCADGHCGFRYQLYRMDANTLVLGVRCDCKPDRNGWWAEKGA